MNKKIILIIVIVIILIGIFVGWKYLKKENSIGNKKENITINEEKTTENENSKKELNIENIPSTETEVDFESNFDSNIN